MRVAPVEPVTGDVAAAVKPTMGKESKIVKVSFEPFYKLGTITFSAADAADDDLPAGELSMSGGAASSHLQLVAQTGVKTAAALTVTLNVKFDSDTDGTAVAKIAPAAYSGRTSFHMPQFAGADFIVQGVGNADKKIEKIVSVASVTGGSAGTRFEILQLPDEDKWELLKCINQKNPTLPVAQGVAIPCGDKANAYTKPGIGEVGNLELVAKHFEYGHSLTMVAGHTVHILIEVRKENRFVVERQVYLDVIMGPQFSAGDGDDIDEDTATGIFSACGIFGSNQVTE